MFVTCARCGASVNQALLQCWQCGQAMPPKPPNKGAAAWPYVLTIGVAFVVFVGYSQNHKAPATDSSVPAVTSEAPPPLEDVSLKCPACKAGNALPPSFHFRGRFADANCTSPIAQATFFACQPVHTKGVVEVQFNDTLGAHVELSTAKVTLVRQLGESEKVYIRPDGGGACVLANDTGNKITPVGCEGKRICRNTSNLLSCNNCREAPPMFAAPDYACDDFEGSLARVTFQP